MLHYVKQQNKINNTRNSTDQSFKLDCTHLQLKIKKYSRKLENDDLINQYHKRIYTQGGP